MSAAIRIVRSLRVRLAAPFLAALLPAAALAGAPAAPADAQAELAMYQAGAGPSAAPLRVRITGAQATGADEPGGAVRAVLYGSREAFLVRPQARLDVPVEGREPVVAEFASLAPGDYAVVVFHDVNGNGVLDRGAFGVPLEPIGFSNGFVPGLSRPDFEDVRVRHSGGALDIEIELRPI